MPDTGTSNPKPSPTDKIYGITNIKSYAPLLLDLERLNYDSWKELFKTHCIGYKVYDHLLGSASLTTDPEWETIDNIVKQWLYGTLTQPVLQAILKSDATAADVWKAIQDLFHENKESKAMELDDELRNIVIGDSTIMEYCNKIKSIADLLTNIGSPVPERNLVIYDINGLSPKYAHVVTTIRHQKPFPSFLEMRSMLTLEERSLLKDHTRLVQAHHHDNSSSPTVLATEHQNRPSQNGRGTPNNGRGGGRNQRGGGRGGRSGGGRGGRGRFGSGGFSPAQTTGWGGGFFAWPMSYSPQQRGLLQSPTAQQQPSWNTHPRSQPSPSWPNANSAQQQAMMAAAQPMPSPNGWPFFQYTAPVDQPTSLPQAFSTMSLRDPGNADWFFDTGATAHLHADTGHPDQTNPPSM